MGVREVVQQVMMRLLGDGVVYEHATESLDYRKSNVFLIFILNYLILLFHLFVS